MNSHFSRRHAVMLLAASLLGVSSAASSAEKPGIVVYNAQHESLTQAWVDAFTRKTGIKVTLRNGSDSEMGNQIVQEGAASPADVFLTENSPAMVLVDKAGLLAQLPADTLEQVPAQYRPEHGRWMGIAARSTVFVYNRKKLEADKLPASLLDLADPVWKGRWGAAPAGADFQAIVSALLELKGEAATAQWLSAMKNNAVTFKKNGIAMKSVNDGTLDGAVIYHYYWFGDQAKTGENSKNVAQHYFRKKDPGAFVSISGGAVLASSKHKSEAEQFLKWITGKGGQEILKTGSSYEYAVGVGAQSNPALVPLAELDAPAVDPSNLNNKKVIDLMISAGLL